MMKIRVVLADDHIVVRQGLHALLATEKEIEIVGEADNGRQAVQMVKDLSPDVVVMDMAMPLLNGLDATRQITQAAPVKSRTDTLTVRQSQVLQLIAEGFINKEIAARLGISSKTVEKHRDQVMKKLGIHDTAGLTRHAVAKGISTV
jgi:DNA-binding NarL/FixJ family response regulator